jgi:hypothetical protein
LRPFAFFAVAAAYGALLSAVFAACGGGDICLGCSPSPTASGSTTVTVQGQVVFSSIGSVGPFPVYICVDEPETTDPTTCEDPFRTTTDSLSGDFLRTSVAPGSQQIFFLNEPPSEEGALSAKLLDPDGELADVEGGFTVTVDNVEIDFNTNVASGEISVTENPTPTPAPSSTPSPTPT